MSFRATYFLQLSDENDCVHVILLDCLLSSILFMQVWTPVDKFISILHVKRSKYNLLRGVLHIPSLQLSVWTKGQCFRETCLPDHCCVLPSLCPSLASYRSPIPVFSRPNWPCRSSWPRVWLLASCPAPSPHQLCAQWLLTRWLCATRWAPPPSSRPHSWALHCSGLLRGRCGPRTHPSSSPLIKDLTGIPVKLWPCPFTKSKALVLVWPRNKGHIQTMQPTWLKMGRVHKFQFITRPDGLRVLLITKAKIPFHAFFLLLWWRPQEQHRPPDSDWHKEAAFIAISWVNMV